MPPIRDKFTIHSKAVVCQDVELKGDITIGAGTIVHPKATIFAIAGPIVIGSGCIIEEGAIIVNRRKEVMRIGDDNLFEIGCRVESPTVGNCNTVCTRARVHHTLRMSSYCVIGAGVLVVPTEDEMLDDYTTIYGPSAERRIWSGRGKVQEMDLRRKHAEYLREMLPKFNRLRRGDGTSWVGRVQRSFCKSIPYLRTKISVVNEYFPDCSHSASDMISSFVPGNRLRQQSSTLEYSPPMTGEYVSITCTVDTIHTDDTRQTSSGGTDNGVIEATSPETSDVYGNME